MLCRGAALGGWQHLRGGVCERHAARNWSAQLAEWRGLYASSITKLFYEIYCSWHQESKLIVNLLALDWIFETCSGLEAGRTVALFFKSAFNLTIPLAMNCHSNKQSRDSFGCFSRIKKLLGQAETRTHDRICFQSIRTV